MVGRMPTHREQHLAKTITTMPQHKSAAKRARQDEERRERNRLQRTRMRTLIKNLRQTTDKEDAEALLPKVKGALDRLASKGLIHKNKAANYKSELEKHVNALDSTASSN